jgi:hypothetical protein
MILQMTKTPNGLFWDNKEWNFTKAILPDGYEIQGDDFAFIELNNEITMLCCKDSTIDGIGFSNIQDELNYIFGV